ncbi:hypothetical protein C8J56DRAFT_1166142 [Mycena floridula]|nr:hypothetical protein C8J56DRAFT_1166142 [Mycena floridula]
MVFTSYHDDEEMDDPDSSPTEKLHPGDWDNYPKEEDDADMVSSPESGSFEYEIRKIQRAHETEIMRLESQISKQKEQITDLRDYVKALEKARDLLPLMRLSHNHTIDLLVESRAKVSAMQQLLISHCRVLDSEVRMECSKSAKMPVPSPASHSISEVIELLMDARQKVNTLVGIFSSNFKQMKTELIEHWEKPVEEVPKPFDFNAEPPEGRDAWDSRTRAKKLEELFAS